MKVAFVSGAYRASTKEGIDNNIARAKELSIKLWQKGYAVICPHMNTAHLDGLCPDDIWLSGYIEIMKRCDIVVMLERWELSEGAREEYRVARELGIETLSEYEIIGIHT